MTEDGWVAPEVVYVQIEDEHGQFSRGPWVDEITWCSDRIHNSDVVYIRRDMCCVVNQVASDKIEEPFDNEDEEEDGDDT